MAVATFATLPYARLVAANLDEDLATGRVLLYWLATVILGATSVWLASRRSIATARRTAVVLSVFLLLFFEFRPISEVQASVGIPDRWHSVGWCVVAGAVTAIAFWVSGKQPVQRFVAAFGAALLAAPIATVAVYRPVTSVPAAASDDMGSRTSVSPNVYFLMVDGYARPDVLEEMIGLDVSEFLGWLETRGFHVSRDAMANYPTTFLSVSSTLQMTYLADETAPMARGPSYYRFIRGDNATVKKLVELGYQYIHAYPGVFPNSRCSGVEDVCIGSGEFLLSDTDLAILESTPLWTWVPTGDRNSRLARYADPSYVVREALAASDDSFPHFLFAHLLSPHPPYLRRASCEVRDIEWDLRNWGADRPVSEYAEAIQCLNKQLNIAIDYVIDQDPDALVVLQADHGYGPTSDWTKVKLDDPAAKERFAILSAIRFPEACRWLEVPADLTPVNTFRLVMACLENRPPDLLANRHYGVNYGGSDVHLLRPATSPGAGEP